MNTSIAAVVLAEGRNDTSKGDYHLTDIVVSARAEGYRVAAAEDAVKGVNLQAGHCALEQKLAGASA